MRSPLIALCVALVSACSIQLVADYDSANFEEALRIGRKVDLFYATLLETEAGDRAYATYAARYLEIEADLRSFHLRNKVRPLNEESTQIAKDLLDLWTKYKEAHKQADVYSSDKAEIHRDRLGRMFMSAADAETAKKLEASDRDAAGRDAP